MYVHTEHSLGAVIVWHIDVKNKHTFCALFFEYSDSSICIIMRHWSLDSRKATSEELAHQSQLLVNLQTQHWKSAKKKGQRAEAVSWNTKQPKKKIYVV